MVITLNLTTDVYSQPDKKGNQRIIKKGVKFKKTFDTNNIQVQNYIDAKGNISSKYSMVFEGEQGYKALHKFEELERLVSPLKIRGFK